MIWWSILAIVFVLAIIFVGGLALVGGGERRERADRLADEAAQLRREQYAEQQRPMALMNSDEWGD